ncbi:MAG: 4Fe-4S dicluster domain-containing protein [Chloroflexota bacterium]|nr:4Fe-4S dicluster domain-containing protein [Chloroflexota bacterium]
MSDKMISVYIMDQQYEVPASLTIMRAFEYAGYKMIRGAGCRGGFCGACATVYRMTGDNKLNVALACQTVVRDGMRLAQIPSFPANKMRYDFAALKPDGATLLEVYPELGLCKGCNTCTKACPQELEVMEYIAASLRGDIARAADLSFDCIACGLCTARCMGELTPYNIALLARRLYGAYLAPRSPHLVKRVEEIQAGRWNKEMMELKELPLEELKKRYNAREIEK